MPVTRRQCEARHSVHSLARGAAAYAGTRHEARARPFMPASDAERKGRHQPEHAPCQTRAWGGPGRPLPTAHASYQRHDAKPGPGQPERGNRSGRFARKSSSSLRLPSPRRPLAETWPERPRPCWPPGVAPARRSYRCGQRESLRCRGGGRVIRSSASSGPWAS
jgi:hypothetical protein